MSSSPARAALDAGASTFGVTDWRAALAQLAERHPTIETYYGAFAETWAHCRDLAIADNLVTWPDYPIPYVPQARWAREAAPYLYFLPYRSPAPYDHLPSHV